MVHALYVDSKLELTIQPDLLLQYTHPGPTNTSSSFAGSHHKLARKCYKLSDTSAAASSSGSRGRGRDGDSDSDRVRGSEQMGEQDGEVSGHAVLVVIRHPFAASIVDEAQSVLNNYKRYDS